MRDEPITISIWIPPELQDSPLRAVVDHYVARGWTVCDATACDMALRNLSVKSIHDLSPEQRVRCGCRLPSDKWIVEVELDKGGLRRNNRAVRFEYSSVSAPWLEHPVEIDIEVPEYRPDRPAAKGQTRETKMALEELTSLAEATLASWAIVTSVLRAPSIPELLGGDRCSRIDLMTVFLSDLDFDDHAIAMIPDYAHKEHWAAGWLMSVSPYMGLSLPAAQVSHFENIIWRLLSSWAHRQRRW